ncbi:MAG: hypothetical protein E7552_07660 [Ruminococcaceae bacterium]|nr:hypothetical protein [Oscillospiraceae bacterium]
MCQTVSAPQWAAITPRDKRFSRPEPLVAGYVLTDFLEGGEEDCSPVIQTLLNRLHQAGGGALYIPAGDYTCRTPIRVPIGVTILGDWERPSGRSTIGGTVLCWRGPALSAAFDTPFISLSHSSCIRGVTFWYPTQTVANPTPYPAAVRTAHWATAREITFINTWVGVEQLLGDSPSMYDIYGTALSVGIYDERVSDIMRLERTCFSPDFWLCSGRFTEKESDLRAYLLAHATGVIFKRTDWSYYTDSAVDGYHTGVVFDAGNCYGQGYNVTVKNCRFGVISRFTHGNGQALTNWRIEHCACGVYIPADAAFSAVLFQDTVIDADRPLLIEHNAKTSLIDCTVTRGDIAAADGMLLLMNNRLPATDIALTGGASLVAVGNEGLTERNVSTADAATLCFDPAPADIATFRASEKQAAAAAVQTRAPAERTVYTPAALGVTLDNRGTQDVTAALNACLESVGITGGTLYLPAGHYRLESTVYIPRGVQLRGAADLCQMAYNTATVLDIAHTARGVVLRENSGLCALTVCHPLQTAAHLRENGAPLPHDFAVYAKDAADVYVQNVSFLNAYNGILLDGCDRHYADGVGGTFLQRGIVVQNSADGIVRDVQLNYQPLVRGHEWPNDLLLKGEENARARKRFFQQMQEKSEIFVFDAVRDEMVFGCFTYLGGRSLVFSGDTTTATVIGFGGDYVSTAVDIRGGERIQLVNAQSTAFVYTSYTDTPINDVYDVRLRDTFRGVAEMVNFSPRQLPVAVFLVEGGTLRVTNLNVACGIPHNDTPIEKAVFARVTGAGSITICGMLQYSPNLTAEDISAINGGFCGSRAFITAKNMMRSTERFGE